MASQSLAAAYAPQIALGIFASYFLLIIGLFIFVIRSLFQIAPTQRVPAKVALFGALSVGSLIHTWYWMIRFMQWSFWEHVKSDTRAHFVEPPFQQRFTEWLIETTLFEQAWKAVCKGAMNWWWSEQLCLFTVLWTVLVAVEGYRWKVRHLWAYMLLGQVVAISVASNLFYVALVLAQNRDAPRKETHMQLHPRLSPKLWLPVLISLSTIYLSPFTLSSPNHERWFLPNLLVMHFLLVVSLVSKRAVSNRHSWSVSPSSLYLVIAVLVAIIRTRTRAGVAESVGYDSSGWLPVGWKSQQAFYSSAWQVLNDYHPAQSSIGWDIVWSTASFFIFLHYHSRPSHYERAVRNGTSETASHKIMRWLVLPGLLNWNISLYGAIILHRAEGYYDGVSER